MTPANWISIGTAAVGILFTLVTVALAVGGLRQKITELDKRVGKVEGDMEGVARSIADMRVEMARIPEQLSMQGKIAELQFKAVDHSINGLKQVIENGLPRPRPPRPAGG